MACGCLGSMFRLAYALFYLLVVFPITAILAIIVWVFQMLGYSWLFFFLVVLSLISIPITKYSNVVNSDFEYLMRCYVEPVWHGTILPIWELAEVPYNLLICVWDAINWSFFGYFTDVLIPAGLDCGAKEVFVTMAPVARIFIQDFIGGYFATGNFLHSFYDITNLGVALVNFWTAWVNMWCCFCLDLCVLFQCAPVPILFIVYPFIQVSGYFLQLEFWLSVGSAINVTAALIQMVVQLIVQIFTVGLANVNPRPDLEVTAGYVCEFAHHFVRATENVIQCFWDSFVPWNFKWGGFLCVVDTVVCIAGDLAVIGFRALVHVDTIFLDIFTPDPNTGIGPRPGSIWHTSIRADAIRFFNTIAPITDPAFYQDVHVLGRMTFIECLCTFIRRLICDPSDTDTPCFSNAAASFLANFDFCCLTNTVLTLANDFTKGLFELFLHTTDADSFFLWVDNNPQYEILIGVNGDLIHVVGCVLSSLEFIPVVGFCLKHVIVSIIAFVTGMIQFAFRGVMSLITLPFFLIVLHQNNLLLRPGELLALYEEAVNVLIAETPSSMLNCLCYILNSIHIPPITLDINNNFVPCGCQAVGFIPPPDVIVDKIENAFDWKNDYLAKRFKNSAINRLTPILVYEIEKDLAGRNHSVINPIYLKERILENMALYGATVIPELVRNVDQFIETKTREIRAKWEKIRTCQEKRTQAEEMRVKYPWRYKYLLMKGELPGKQEDCERYEEYLIPFGSSGPIDQLAYDRQILDKDHFLHAVREEELEGRNNSYFAKLPNQAVWKWDKYAAFHGDSRYNATSNITVSMTMAPEMGCPGPNQPLLPCFDLCCIPRATLLLIGHTMNSLARLVNALIQGNFQNPAWQYFTGVSCPACFEQDLVTLIRRLVGPIACGCQLFDLILPSSPNFPRPDLCCAITFLGDFVGGILQIIINGIKSLALDSPNFFYFTMGGFINDANVLFDLTLDIQACICNVVRYVFPISQLTGGGFDPCCLAQNLMLVLVEVQRWLLQIIINLALITASPTAIHYWRDPGISRGYTIYDNIGFVVQGEVVINAIFGTIGGPCATQGKDQGLGGISQCVCQILSTIIPIRPHPELPVSEPNNCPIFDLCCPIRGISILLGDWNKFQLRALVSTWQSWFPQDYGRPVGDASPISFLDYIFCDEENPTLYPSCGKLDPAITDFVNIVVGCPCEFGRLADAWLTMVLPAHNFQCFCGPTLGFFTNVGGLVESLTRAIITLIRRIAEPSYWNFNQGGPSNNAIEDSWIFRFLGPSINHVCNLVASLLCVTNSILDLPCTEYQYRIVRSVVRWILESVLRVGAFFEGFILIFAEGVNSACPAPTLCPATTSGSQVYGQCPMGNLCTQGTMCDTPCPSGTAGATGISVAQLAEAFVDVVTFPMDLLFADSEVLCSVLNPPQCPPGNPCCCYHPAGSYIFKPVGGIYTLGNQCAQCIDDTCMFQLDSYAFPTCRTDTCDGTTFMPPCDSQSGFYKPLPCVNRVLVSCDVNNDKLDPLDGIVMAVLRYMRCMIAALISPGLAQVFDALISLISFIWQIFTPILRFIAAMVLFVILLFGFLNGGCACWGSVTGQYVQRGGLCYPCEENPNIRSTWWSDANNTFNPAYYGPKPGPAFTWPGEMCLAGYNYPQNLFLNHTNVRAIDNRLCIDQRLAAGPNGCAATTGGNTGCGAFATNPGQWPGLCEVCNWFGNNRGEVGNSIDCGGSCTPCGANALVLCGIIQLWKAFGDIFRSFIQVFTVAPINPKPPGKRSSWWRDRYEQFNGRDHRGKQSDMPWHQTQDNTEYKFKQSGRTMHEFKRQVDTDTTDGIFSGGNTIKLMMAAVYDYDISMCPDDLRTCVCQNFIVPPEVCGTDTANIKRATETRDKKLLDDLSVPIMNHMPNIFDGTTRCDYLIADCANMSWSMVPTAEKLHYIDCLDKRIQGTRINTVMPDFPVDFFHINTGPMDFLVNVQTSVARALKRSRDNAKWDQEFERTRSAKIDPTVLTRGEELRRGIMRRRQNILRDAKKDLRWSGCSTLPFFVKLDPYEYRLRSGLYTRLTRDAWYNLKYGTWSIPFASWWDGLLEHTSKLGGHVYQAQWRRTLDSAYRGFAASFEVMDDLARLGPWQMMRNARARIPKSPERIKNEKRAEAVREMTKAAFYQGPVYKWWTSRTGTFLDFRNPFGVFLDHIGRTFRWHRDNWKRMEPSAFTLDLHMKNALVNSIGKRWEKKWTSKKLANWESLTRIFYRVKHALVPGSYVPPKFLSRTRDERGFVVNGNCRLVDGLIDEIVFLVTYCASDFMPNYPLTRRVELRNTSAAWRWFEDLAERGQHLYGGGDRMYIPDEQREATRKYDKSLGENGEKWTGVYDWAMFRGLNWIRPKFRPFPNPQREERSRTLKHISRQQWLRAVSSAPFEVTSWLVQIIDSVFNINLDMEITNFINDVEAWVNNVNTDYKAGPVGLKYWLLFWVKCQVKPTPGQLPSNAFLNLNCSVGIGLESALGWVLFISFWVFIVGSIIFPATLLPLVGGTAFIFYIVVVPAVAWHYSPRCWLMTPAVAIAGINGISVPLLPFPVAFPALPFCLMTEFRHLFNKYITTCYSVLWGTNLEFLFPRYMIIGDPCPACFTKVTMLNCGALGLGGGITNLAYLIVWIWPGATAFVQELATIGQGSFLQGIMDSLVSTFESVSGLTGTTADQFNYCFWLTSTSLAGTLFIAIIAITLFIVLWGILINGLGALANVIVQSPIMYLVPGSGSNLYDDLFGSQQNQPQGRGTRSANSMPDAYIGVRFEEERDANGRRIRRPAQRPSRAMDNSPLLGWFDHAAAAAHEQLGYVFNALKRD